jgi:hypothetical protein
MDICDYGEFTSSSKWLSCDHFGADYFREWEKWLQIEYYVFVVNLAYSMVATVSGVWCVLYWE